MIAISSAFKKALIGVNIDGKVSYRELDSNCKHSENILPQLDNILTELDKELSQNKSYALVVGPGAFTGLRIGISLVKGFLAGDGNKNIVSLTTFELMAYTYIKNYQPKEDFYCVIDALSNFYFICKFSSKGEKKENERIVERELVDKLNGDKIGLSEENLNFVNTLIEPSAQELLELALKKEEAYEFTRPENLIPLYLRKSQAEVALDEKNKI